MDVLTSSSTFRSVVIPGMANRLLAGPLTTYTKAKNNLLMAEFGTVSVEEESALKSQKVNGGKLIKKVKKKSYT